MKWKKKEKKITIIDYYNGRKEKLFMSQFYTFLEEQKQALRDRIREKLDKGYSINSDTNKLEYLETIIYKWKKLEDENEIGYDEPIKND